jgi:hypothetical protein
MEDMTMLAVPMAMMGLWFFIVGFELFCEARHYVRRPKAKASIISATLAQRGNGSCYVRLEYGYEVGGVRYTAAETWPPTRNVMRATAEKELSRFTPGSEIVVAYDPQQPALTMLGGISMKREVIFILVGVLLGAVSVSLVYADLRPGPPPALPSEPAAIEVEKR